MGNPWANPPTVGCVEYGTISTVGLYQPISKNETTYSIPVNSISKSINVYLGATGVSYNNSSLNVFYLRQNSNPVSIGLTFVSSTGSWKSGGFVEVDSSTLPGVYRFDLPNEMLVSGVNNANLIVRGSNLYNGAFINIDLIESVTNSSIANTVWTNASRTITGGIADTVTTLSNRSGFAITGNTDKTGYSLSQSFPANFSSLSIAGGKVSIVQSDINSIIASIPEVNYSGIAATTWNFLASAIGNTLSIGYQLISNLDTTVSSRSTLTSKQVISAIQASVRTVSQVNKDKISKL